MHYLENHGFFTDSNLECAFEGCKCVGTSNKKYVKCLQICIESNPNKSASSRHLLRAKSSNLERPPIQMLRMRISLFLLMPLLLPKFR